MERGDRLLRPARGGEAAAVPQQPEVGAEDRARRRRAEAHEHLGLDRRDLRLHPRAAGRELAEARRLVYAALAALDELEVLDRVRHVEALAAEAHLGQRPVEHLARRTDERRSEEHTSELQSRGHLVCRLLLEKKNTPIIKPYGLSLRN